MTRPNSGRSMGMSNMNAAPCSCSTAWHAGRAHRGRGMPRNRKPTKSICSAPSTAETSKELAAGPIRSTKRPCRIRRVLRYCRSPNLRCQCSVAPRRSNRTVTGTPDPGAGSRIIRHRSRATGLSLVRISARPVQTWSPSSSCNVRKLGARPTIAGPSNRRNSALTKRNPAWPPSARRLRARRQRRASRAKTRFAIA